MRTGEVVGGGRSCDSKFKMYFLNQIVKFPSSWSWENKKYVHLDPVRFSCINNLLYKTNVIRLIKYDFVLESLKSEVLASLVEMITFMSAHPLGHFHSFL